MTHVQTHFTTGTVVVPRSDLSKSEGKDSLGPVRVLEDTDKINGVYCKVQLRGQVVDLRLAGQKMVQTYRSGKITRMETALLLKRYQHATIEETLAFEADGKPVAPDFPVVQVDLTQTFQAEFAGKYAANSTANAAFLSLSTQQRSLLCVLARAKSIAQIARDLGWSRQRVYRHLPRLRIGLVYALGGESVFTTICRQVSLAEI